jgi:hypothetical protein
VSQPDQGPNAEKTSSWHDGVGRIGVDWWATVVAGVIAALAATDLLPKIPW